MVDFFQIMSYLLFTSHFAIRVCIILVVESVVRYVNENFTFMWPCIVTDFFIIKLTRCTNFTNLFLAWNSTCFWQFLCPSSGVYWLYTRQWYMSYRFVDSFRAGPGWNSIMVLLEFHTRINLWKLVHLVSFIIKKFVTMYGQTNVKEIQWKRVSSKWQMVKTHIMHR